MESLEAEIKTLETRMGADRDAWFKDDKAQKRLQALYHRPRQGEAGEVNPDDRRPTRSAAPSSPALPKQPENSADRRLSGSGAIRTTRDAG